MRLAAKLIGYLHRVFDRDPRRLLALRLAYDGQLSWQVADGVLTTTVAGGSGTDLTVDLSAYTLAGLAGYLAARPGYSVPYLDVDLGARGALALLDGSGSQEESNGDHLYVHDSLLWALMDAFAVELAAAQAAILAMLDQMAVTTADGEWLDEWGGYFGVPRLAGEGDPVYGPRIIEEVLAKHANNRALEALVERATGYTVEVRDLSWRTRDNLIETNRKAKLLNRAAWVFGPEHADLSGNRAFLESLGFTAFAPGRFPRGGYPYWGDAANDLPIVCAFAVLIGARNAALLPAADLALIKRVVDRSRAAGTLALYCAPAGILRTNVLDETWNTAGWTCGPRAASYTVLAL
jgi:hypothetical protein